MTGKSGSPAGRASFYYLAIILVTLILSVSALSLGVVALENQDVNAGAYMLVGFIGLALSAYMLLQTQRKPSRAAFEMPRVITTILCQKCGFKNIRDFQRGDYVFKDTEPCPKCNEKTMIASIYREVKEKGKEG